MNPSSLAACPEGQLFLFLKKSHFKLKNRLLHIHYLHYINIGFFINKKIRANSFVALSFSSKIMQSAFYNIVYFIHLNIKMMF